MQSFPLLTGGKGIHVIAPLNETADWARVSGFAKTFAKRLAHAKPDLFTASQRKSHRTGRIFIDWQRNRKSATAIAPWSPRARRRLASLKRDPWDGYSEADQTVPEL